MTRGAGRAKIGLTAAEPLCDRPRTTATPRNRFRTPSHMAGPPTFDTDFRTRFRDLLGWRRDVRKFRRDRLPGGTLERLLQLACLAPSVGLSEPWRFVVVREAALGQDQILFRGVQRRSLERPGKRPRVTLTMRPARSLSLQTVPPRRVTASGG